MQFHLLHLGTQFLIHEIISIILIVVMLGLRLKVLLEHREQLELVVEMATEVLKVQKVEQVFKEQREPKEMLIIQLVHKDLKVLKVEKVQLDIQDTTVLLVVAGQLVIKDQEVVLKDLAEIQDFRGITVTLILAVEYKDLKVLKVLKVLLDIKDI